MNLNTQVEELEKRISAQNKKIENIKNVDSELSNLANGVSALQTELATQNASLLNLSAKQAQQEETLATHNASLTSLSNQVTTQNASITNLTTEVNSHTEELATHNASLTSLSGQVSTHNASISNITTQLNSHAEELATQNASLASLSSQVASHAEELATHNASLSTLSSQIDALEEDVSSLGSSVETLNGQMQDVIENMGSGSSNIYNTGVYENLLVGSKTSSGPKVKIFLRANTGCKIKGKIIAHLKELPTITSVSATLYINDTMINTIEKNGSFSGSLDFEVPISFMPSAISNVIDINFGSALSAAVLDTVDIDLDGQNIMILNRDKSFHFWSFKQVYYMSFNEANHGYFIEQAKASLNLNAPKTEFPYSSSGAGQANGYKYYRRVAFVTDHYNLLTMREQLYTEGENNLFVTNRFGTGQTNIKNYDTGTLDGHLFFRSDAQTYYICYTLEDMSIVVDNYVPLETEGTPRRHPTLNGVELEKRYIQCIPVYDYYMGERRINGHIGFILLDKDGKLSYLPEPDATYMIELGEGVQPNAYLQADDLTLNVYYRFEGNVIKKVLKRADSQSPFVLQEGQSVFPLTQEYIELDGSGSIRKIGKRLAVFE